MGNTTICIGADSFRTIRTEGALYIDKTHFVEELLQGGRAQVSLITRPRRFGKSLMMSMLKEFFNIGTDAEGQSLFEGLAISQNRHICESWQNRYPTVLMSFKDWTPTSMDNAVKLFRDMSASLVGQYEYLVSSNKVNSFLRSCIKDIINSRADSETLSCALLYLTQALHAHWGIPVIVLIDEYDVPVATAQKHGFYSDMVAFLRRLLSSVLKSNASLKLAVLTGCLRLAKESIFTGLNNFRCYGLDEPKFSDKFGFTEAEVAALLSNTGFSDKAGIVRNWYDGYRFGRHVHVYCPWDVLMYILALQEDPDARPQLYWGNTSGNDIIRQFAERAEFATKTKFETLLEGKSIDVTVSHSLTYETLFQNESNLWSLLYLTGYLTKSSDSADATTRLRIPNREVWQIVNTEVRQWFLDKVRGKTQTAFYEAFWSGDATKVSDILSDIMLTTVSFHDAHHEDFYHAVLLGMFAGSGYEVSSNIEVGLGRADIVIEDFNHRRAAIIEVKRPKSFDELDVATKIALTQIDEKLYDAKLRRIPKLHLLHWGMAFADKHCAAAVKVVAQ